MCTDIIPVEYYKANADGQLACVWTTNKLIEGSDLQCLLSDRTC